MSTEDRPSSRQIERTTGVPGSGPGDPGEGLRAHVARSPRRPVQATPAGLMGQSTFAAMPGMPLPPQPPPVIPSMLDVRGPDGSIVKGYGPEDDQAALAHAERIQGCVTIAEVVADFRR